MLTKKRRTTIRKAHGEKKKNMALQRIAKVHKEQPAYEIGSGKSRGFLEPTSRERQLLSCEAVDLAQAGRGFLKIGTMWGDRGGRLGKKILWSLFRRYTYW